MKIMLEVLSGGNAGFKKEFSKDCVTLGREFAPGESSNDVPFKHQADTTASREHCEILLENGAYVLHEKAAKNKTYVNDIPVTSRELKSGDVIQCGTNGPKVKVVILLETEQVSSLETSGKENKTRAETPSVPKESITDAGVKTPASEIKSETVQPSGTGEAPKKELVGKRTVLGMIGLAKADTEKKVKKRVVGLAAAIVVVAISVAALWVKHHYDIKRLEDTDKAIAESLSKTTKAVEKEIGFLKGKARQNDAVIRSYRAQLNEIKKFLPPMRDTIAGARKAVVRVVTTYSVIQPGTRKRIIVSGSSKPVKVRTQGSGFCYDAGGLIITNAHVVEPWRFNKELGDKKLTGELDSILVTFDGTKEALKATVVKSDRDRDLAIIKVSRKGCPVLGIEEESPKEGDNVAILGFPSVVDDAGITANCMVLGGKISRIDPNGRILYDMITHAGNSGGPVINGSGKLVAVHSSGLVKGSKFLCQGMEQMMSLSEDEEKAVVSDPRGTVTIPALEFAKESEAPRLAANINSGITLDAFKKFIGR